MHIRHIRRAYSAIVFVITEIILQNTFQIHVARRACVMSTHAHFGYNAKCTYI
jgi:hypothetical protein